MLQDSETVTPLVENTPLPESGMTHCYSSCTIYPFLGGEECSDITVLYCVVYALDL